MSALTGARGVNVVFEIIGGPTQKRSSLVLTDWGRVVSIVDIATPQSLVNAWGVNGEYHFVFTH